MATDKIHFLVFFICPLLLFSAEKGALDLEDEKSFLMPQSKELSSSTIPSKATLSEKEKDHAALVQFLKMQSATTSLKQRNYGTYPPYLKPLKEVAAVDPLPVKATLPEILFTKSLIQFSLHREKGFDFNRKLALSIPKTSSLPFYEVTSAALLRKKYHLLMRSFQEKPLLPREPYLEVYTLPQVSIQCDQDLYHFTTRLDFRDLHEKLLSDISLFIYPSKTACIIPVSFILQRSPINIELLTHFKVKRTPYLSSPPSENPSFDPSKEISGFKLEIDAKEFYPAEGDTFLNQSSSMRFHEENTQMDLSIIQTLLHKKKLFKPLFSQLTLPPSSKIPSDPSLLNHRSNVSSYEPIENPLRSPIDICFSSDLEITFSNTSMVAFSLLKENAAHTQILSNLHKKKPQTPCSSFLNLTLIDAKEILPLDFASAWTDYEPEFNAFETINQSESFNLPYFVFNDDIKESASFTLLDEQLKNAMFISSSHKKKVWNFAFSSINLYFFDKLRRENPFIHNDVDKSVYLPYEPLYNPLPSYQIQILKEIPQIVAIDESPEFLPFELLNEPLFDKYTPGIFRKKTSLIPICFSFNKFPKIPLGKTPWIQPSECIVYEPSINPFSLSRLSFDSSSFSLSYEKSIPMDFAVSSESLFDKSFHFGFYKKTSLTFLSSSLNIPALMIRSDEMATSTCFFTSYDPTYNADGSLDSTKFCYKVDLSLDYQGDLTLPAFSLLKESISLKREFQKDQFLDHPVLSQKTLLKPPNGLKKIKTSDIAYSSPKLHTFTADRENAHIPLKSIWNHIDESIEKHYTPTLLSFEIPKEQFTDPLMHFEYHFPIFCSLSPVQTSFSFYRKLLVTSDKRKTSSSFNYDITPHEEKNQIDIPLDTRIFLETTPSDPLAYHILSEKFDLINLKQVPFVSAQQIPFHFSQSQFQPPLIKIRDELALPFTSSFLHVDAQDETFLGHLRLAFDTIESPSASQLLSAEALLEEMFIPVENLFDEYPSPLKPQIIKKSPKKVNEENRFTIANLSLLPSEYALDIDELSAYFTLDLEVGNRPDGPGYIFSLALTPKKDIPLNTMKQNFYFLIDRSSSIEKHRFNTFKSSVERALANLNKNDYFNIIFFDKNVEKFDEQPIAANAENLEKAKKFLHAKGHQGLISAGDSLKIISQLKKEIPEDEQLATVILLSNGESMTTLARKKRHMAKLLNRCEKGLFSVYTAAASSGNNLGMLELVSRQIHGNLLYSPTNAAFPRKLAGLVHRLAHPVAHSIHVTPIDAKEDLKLELFGENHLKGLYLNQPLKLYGIIDHLHPFTVMIQGKFDKGWLNLKKKISFDKATKGNSSLQKEYAMLKVQQLYKSYIKEDNINSLKEAEHYLTAFNLPSPNSQ